MSEISPIRIFSSTLCAMSVLLFPIFFTGKFSLPFIIVFPMQFGIIGLGSITIYKYKRTKSSWNAPAPGFVKVSLPMIAVLGVVCIAYGISGLGSDMLSSGQVVHHLNAYFNNEQCYATFNKGVPVAMQKEFCLSFQSHSATAFFGAWMVFSSVLCWFSWKFRGPDIEAEYETNFECERQKAKW